jgi:hypothetical protein
MGGLKPIGSEKLDGMAKINRIMEIARYNENIPTPVNEDKSTEYKITLADGNTYRIDKEKNGYVIKKTISESIEDYDYLEPMKNRKYYNSYSQAFKRLNIVAKEVNINEGYEKNVSLFTESDDVSYYLNLGKKTEANEQAPAAAPAPQPAPAPAPAPQPAPAPAPEGGEELPVSDEVEDMDLDMGEEGDDEEVSVKTIQKITGRLAQKVREFNQQDEQGLSSNDMKYVINSVLSALDLDKLEEEDRESIIEKLENIESEEDFDMEDDMDLGDELEPEVPAEPQGEMAEDYDFEDEDYFEEEYNTHQNRGARKKLHHPELSDEDSIKVEEMFEEIFSESRVDHVLNKYFDKKVVKESVRKENRKNTINKIKQLSENTTQEFSSLKVVEKYPNAKLVGKTISKGLVFEVEDMTLNVSTKGGYKVI